ncbi:uncharacterized protein LOC103568398 isoform X1 [Microplitis demolitor]|uniref:uncharacterized protein LOC103568398 isoform X1 n=1 Tax=Microplitis demolitor TaxID=69319 RepID=UPI00235B6D5B|nr:uncharacterized protein LOC103568398 isoform X1 [Microplitis demolitor]
MNPFDENIDKNVLFNIATGKAASGNVAEFLINIKKRGHQQKLNFIEECNSVPGRFEKPIPRNKILNFASDCATKVLAKKDTSKKVLLKLERDIFGRLLAVSIQKKINIEYCLTFPLAPMPPDLFSCDGGMFKTDKSALTKLLKSDTQIIQPTQINVQIIDGFYYLYQIGASLPQTFDKIAESILIKLCSTNAADIHLVFDRYITPSIKDLERQSRQEFDITFNVSGPQQTRPSDFLKSLKNFRFKEALVHFLSNYWENDNLATIIQNKKVFLTVEKNCYSYQTQHNRVIKTEEIGYLCDYEEADTRMIFHASRVTPGSKILIKSSDTDVLIILLGNIDKLQQSEIWLASSTNKKKILKILTALTVKI